MTISVADAFALLPEEHKERSLLLWEHASLQVELYAPRGADLQRPHARDACQGAPSRLVALSHGRGFD